MDLVAAVCGDRVRVTPDGGLPTVTGADGWAEAAEVVAASGDPDGLIMAPAWRVEAVPVTTVHLVEVGAGPGPWLRLTELARLPHPAEVQRAIATGVAEHRGETVRSAGRPAWFAPGWPVEVERWIADRLGAYGLTRLGPVRVVKWWSLSVILAVPTEAGEVFFKAACDHFRAEPAVTAVLSHRVGGVVPALIGIDADRGWMLMQAVAGAGSGDETDPRLAPAAARTMARVQLTMSGHLPELAAAGAPDRTLGPTLSGLQQVVEDSLELGQLDPAERRTAVDLLPWLSDRLGLLADAGLPYSVGHGDLHLGNVAAAGDRLVLYDWTDAAVTFPVLDAALLAGSAGDEVAPAVLDAFAAVWREVRSEAEVTAALALAPLANTAYQAVTYEAIYRAQEPRTRWEMRGVVARSLRKLGRAWRERDATG